MFVYRVQQKNKSKTTKQKVPNNVIMYWADEQIPDRGSFWDPAEGAGFGKAAMISHTFNDGIGTMTFDQDVTTIGNSALEGTDIKRILIPDTLTSFLNLNDCTQLEEVDLSDCNFTNIRNAVFRNCSSLRKVAFSKKVTIIDGACCGGCQSLQEIDLSNCTELNSITGGAFANCTSLKNVDLSSCKKLESITGNAFASCTSLEHIKFPKEKLYTISQAFGGCSSLKEIDLSNCKNLTYITSSCFGGCNNIEYINLKNCINLYGFETGINDSVSKVKSINLQNCKQIYSISYQFQRCPDLVEINITGCSNLNQISTTFNNCPKLKLISLKGCRDLNSIYYSFNYCPSLKNIIFDNHKLLDINRSFNNSGLTKLDINTKFNIYQIFESFRDCPDLKIVTIESKTMDSIKSNSFMDSGIETLTLKNLVSSSSYLVPGYGNTYYGNPIKTLLIENCDFESSNYIYSNWSSINFLNKLKKLTFKNIPNTIYLANYQFQNHTTLEQVDFINCKAIDLQKSGLFTGCTSLKNITFQNSKINGYITSYAFENCTSLQKIDFSNQTLLTYIGNRVFHNCSSLKSINLKNCNKLQYIGSSTFSGCNSLKKLILDDLPNLNLNSCGSSMIYNSGIEYLSAKNLKSTQTINNNTSIFQSDAIKTIVFDGCSNLTSYNSGVFANYYQPKLEKVSFRNCISLETICGFTDLASLREVDFTGCNRISSFSNAFQRCNKLQKVTFDKNNIILQSFSSCFIACPSLKEIDLNRFKNLAAIYSSSFYNCPNLTNVKLSECSKLTQVINSFQMCDKLKKIEFNGSNLTTISGSFQNCHDLEKVNFEKCKKLYVISSSFIYCDSIKKVKLLNPESGNTITFGGAFLYCKKLEHLDLSGTNVSIGGSFNYCNLRYVDLSNTQQTISISSSFIINPDTDYNNNFKLNLENSELRSFPTYIPGCNYLNLKNCNNLITIGGALSGNNELKEINIEDCNSLTLITGSFNSCKNLEKLNIINCKNLEEIASSFIGINNGPTIESSLSDINIQKCNNLVTIQDNAFGNNKMTSVNFEGCSSELQITNQAFFQCNLLTDINLNNVKSVTSGAFNSNGNVITNINISSTLQILENSLLGRVIDNITIDGNNEYLNLENNCLISSEDNTIVLLGTDYIIPTDYSIKYGPRLFVSKTFDTVTIPSNVIEISPDAFSQCNITYITVDENNPIYDSRDNCNAIIETETNKLIRASLNTIILQSITSIEDYAFSGLEISNITIPDNITSIGNYAFYYCEDLETISLGENVTSIGDRAFYHCISLTNITIPNSVTTIGKYAFYNCSELTSINIGTGVELFDNDCFMQCEKLTSVNITSLEHWYQISFASSDSNPITLGRHLYLNGTEVTDLIVPNTVTSIGKYQFYRCESLTSITIPDSVTSIGQSAFCACYGVLTVNVGNGITSFGSFVFSNCNKLTSITIEATTPPTIPGDIFSDTNNCPIYVPAESVNAYKAANVWKTNSIKNRIQPIPTE